ncbi:right-handed parallel beta-helix repeat-containing protein, partial [Bartonella bovis]|uniref:right-handed parallel beta-helix repeat-containing protein n=1 Tax=Bartonella bovis TaxID=155194 RepID=UPI001304AC85
NISKVKVGVWVTSGNLTVNMGEIKDVQTGITMSGSGRLVVNSGAKITFEGAGHGVKVGGTAMANLTSMTIRGGGATGTGVVMEGTEMMTMTEVGISGVQTGIQVTSGNLTVNGGSMTGVQTGITMLGSGMLVVRDRTRIEFTSGAGNYGIEVGNGANADITGVEIKGGGKGGQGMGVYVQSGASATLTNVNISEVGKGVWMDGTGEMTMERVDILNVEKGVEATAGTLVIKGGTTLQMTNVDVLNVGVGVEAKKGGTLTIKEGSIGFKKDYGIGVWGKATATITGTTIRGEGSGKGVYATGVGKLTLTMTGVNISNVGEGVNATNGTVTIKDGSIGFTSGANNYGIGVGNGVTMATVTGTRITGGGQGTGVLMMETKMMRLDGVTISNVGEGVWVKGTLVMDKGSITVTGNGVKGYGMGVYVGKEATATITGTTIRGAGMGSKGVVMNGKTLGMSGVTIKDVAIGVEVTGGIL